MRPDSYALSAPGNTYALRKYIVLLLIALWLCFSGLAFAEEAELLGPDNWPEAVDDAVQMIISRLSEKDKLVVKSTKKKDLIQFHHGWGTGIRNYYGLWRGNRKLLLSACNGEPCHPDDASMKIIEAVWESLQK